MRGHRHTIGAQMRELVAQQMRAGDRLVCVEAQKGEADALKSLFAHDGRVQVLDGLSEGDRILASLEQDGLADGVAVVPEDEAGP